MPTTLPSPGITYGLVRLPGALGGEGERCRRRAAAPVGVGPQRVLAVVPSGSVLVQDSPSGATTPATARPSGLRSSTSTRRPSATRTATGSPGEYSHGPVGDRRGDDRLDQRQERIRVDGRVRRRRPPRPARSDGAAGDEHHRPERCGHRRNHDRNLRNVRLARRADSRPRDRSS